MATTTVGTGSLGSTWTCQVDLVSQNQAANTSVVRVQGILYNNSTSTSFNNNPINQYISGSGSWSQNTGMSVPGKTTQTMFDQSFTIAADSAGNSSVSFTAGFAATGTSGLGGPTSATAGMALPRIPKVPSAPTGYSARNVTYVDAYTTGLTVADDGGSALDDWKAEYNTSQSDSGALYADPGSVTDPHMTGLNPGVAYSFRVAAHNAIGWSPWGAWVSFSTPQVNLPHDPPAVTATRNSDASIGVSWTTNYTDNAGGYPWVGVYVDRSTDGGAYATVATIVYTTQAWTDTTTSPDHGYLYRVRAYNGAGASAGTLAPVVYTTPATPGTPAATKSGSNIVLAFTNASNDDAGIKVYRSDAGGAFALIDTVATANLTSYTDVAPSASVTHAYQVATYNGSLISAPSPSSNTVQLLAAPNAPTNLTLSVPTTFDAATNAVTMSWTHNPVDSTAQTTYDLRYRIVGAPSWTDGGAVASTVSSAAFPAGTFSNGNVYEWQVETQGQLAGAWSPWSASAQFTTSTTPTVLIVSGSVANPNPSATGSFSWTYYDAEGTPQNAWDAQLLAAGTVVEDISGQGTAASVTFATHLTNGGAYTYQVRVQDGSGLWSAWASAAFTVSYASPPTPTLTATWDVTTGTVLVVVTNPSAGSGQVSPDHNEVYRSVDGGPAVLLASGVALNGSVTDPIPVFGVGHVNTYTATAVSAIPSTATSAPVDLADIAAQGWIWLNAGPGFSVTAHLRANPALSITAGRQRALRHFVGRQYPVEFMATMRDQVLSLSGLLEGLDAANTEAAFVAVADTGAPVCYRDVFGRRVFVSMSPPAFSLVLPSGQYETVSTTLTAVDYVEAY